MKRVLVTGATRGIGESIARTFKEHSYTVLGTGTKDIDCPSHLDEYYSCDFTSNDSLIEFVKQVKDLEVDVLINNAGINILDDFCNIKPAEFLRVQYVNLYAPFRVSQAVIPHMRSNNWGRIVNISSVWSKKSKQGAASYSTSKFGIDGMTIAMSHEFASQGILCNCVSPGFTSTDMTWQNLGEEGVNRILQKVPINRLAEVDEVAKLVYMLGSEENTYISGQNISIDGGFTRA